MPNRDREEMQSKRSVSLLEGYSELWMYLRGHGLVVPRLGTCTEAEESSQESEESLRCCGGVLPLLAFGQSCGVGRGVGSYSSGVLLGQSGVQLARFLPSTHPFEQKITS